MSSIAARTYLTPEEYIAAERKATLKSEYLSGEIVARSGASNEHNLITMNTANGLYNQVTDQGCRVYASDMRVRTCCHSFRLRQNSPYIRFIDSLNLKPMTPFKPPVASKRGIPLYAGC